MTHSPAVSNGISISHIESRQARLDAAIALFRSEASASGYVVEEVRLRLPVPDVDVMPRVIIAQQNLGNTPPPFPRAKHARQMPVYPMTDAGERLRHPGQEAYMNSPKGTYARPPSSMPVDTKFTTTAGKSNGFKRTVSGSVIFHPVPARASHMRENVQPRNGNGHNGQKMGPLSSIPYMPTKDSGSTPAAMNGQRNGEVKNGQFWKTVIGGEKGKAILRAAESMHRMRHGANGPKFVPPFAEGEKKNCNGEWKNGKKEEDVRRKSENDSSDSSDGEIIEEEEKVETVKKEEKSHKINGHDIPESHVQLLLSSVTDISARERATTAAKKKREESPEVVVRENKRKEPTSRTGSASKSRGSGTRNTASYGRPYSSRRRDSGDRHTSRGSAARPFKCHKCSSSFDREGHLRVHILAVHEKKRPFVCQVCDASFGHSSSLLRHVRTVHQASPAIGSGRVSHSRGSNPGNSSDMSRSDELSDEMEDDDEKHFRCSVCSQAFNRVALLNRHVARRHPLRSSPPSKSMDDSDDDDSS